MSSRILGRRERSLLMSIDAIREGGRAWKVVNYALLNAAWFGAVVGSAEGQLAFAWTIGLGVLVVHLALVRDRRPDLRLMAATIVIGGITETVTGGLGAYTVSGDPMPAPLPPSWILLLWAVFAITLRHCMVWLRGRTALAAALGAIGGPLSMLGGARLGALTVAEDRVWFWLVVGVQWAIVLPVLVHIGGRPAERSLPI